MSFSDIPVRSNSQTVDASWWNTIRTALVNVFGSGLTTETQFTIANNQGAAADVTGLVFDKDSLVQVRIEYRLMQRDDAENRVTYGQLVAFYNSEDDSWTLDDNPDGGDLSGVTFSIDDADTSAAQIQYTSDDMSGGNEARTMRHKVVLSFAPEV